MGGACGHKVAGARRPGHPGTAKMAMVFENQSGLGLAAAAEMSRQRSGMQGAKIELHVELTVAAIPLSLPRRRWLWFDKDFSFAQQLGWYH